MAIAMVELRTSLQLEAAYPNQLPMMNMSSSCDSGGGVSNPVGIHREKRVKIYSVVSNRTKERN